METANWTWSARATLGGGSGALTLLTNNGNNVFGVNTVLWLGGGGPRSVTAADVNGDGKPDLITANTLDGTLTVLTNNGSGVFSANATLNDFAPQPVTVADVNGDGKPDLISVNGDVNFPETLTIFTNNGNGFFGSNATLNVSATSGNTFPINVVAADVNGDGKPDLVCPSPAAGAVEIWTNNGSGIFGSNAAVNVGGLPNWVAVADINDNGKPDIICANEDNYLTVLTNNGNGVFGSNATLLTFGEPHDVVVADVNGDGKPDLIIAGWGQFGGLPPPHGFITVLTNNGSGSFDTNDAQFFGLPSLSVAVGDVNGDGKPDLVSADAYDNLLRVWTNNGAGVFGSNATLSVEGTPASVALADVNRDGKPDVICASYDSSASGYPGYLTIFTNNGSGGFGLDATLNVGSYPVDVVAANVNANGRLDLITANYEANDLSVLLNVPYLDMDVQTNGENLVWPYPSSGYVLQQNADLGTTNWVDMTNTPDFIGGQNQVTLPSPAGNAFFRLRHP